MSSASTDLTEAIRELSVVMFGQRLRLEIMARIAASEDGIVCLKDLASDLGASPSSVQKPLKDLVAAGLLTPLPAGDSKRRFYQRTPSSGWGFASELVDDCERASTKPTTNFMKSGSGHGPSNAS